MSVLLSNFWIWFALYIFSMFVSRIMKLQHTILAATTGGRDTNGVSKSTLSQTFTQSRLLFWLAVLCVVGCAMFVNVVAALIVALVGYLVAVWMICRVFIRNSWGKITLPKIGFILVKWVPALLVCISFFAVANGRYNVLFYLAFAWGIAELFIFVSAPISDKWQLRKYAQCHPLATNAEKLE